MKKIITFIALLFVSTEITLPQTFGTFGLKGGLIFNGISTLNDGETHIVDKNAFFNFLSYDLGIYGEFFNSKKFCLSTELHFTRRGERNPNYLGVVEIINTSQGDMYEFKYLSDRFYYLSLQLLPKYRLVLTPSNESLYLLAGPKLDLMISSMNSGNMNNIKKLENPNLEIGALFGISSEIADIFSFEFRFEYSFTPVYTISYDKRDITRHHNTLLFLTGLNVRKLLKI